MGWEEEEEGKKKKEKEKERGGNGNAKCNASARSRRVVSVRTQRIFAPLIWPLCASVLHPSPRLPPVLRKAERKEAAQLGLPAATIHKSHKVKECAYVLSG